MDTYTLLIILISAALALGIYGVVVQRGANLVKIDGRMTLMSGIWAVLELLASLSGYGIGRWVLGLEEARNRNIFWIHLLAGVIFAAIGVRMLFLAFHKKSYLEHRMEKLDIRTDFMLSLRLCLHGCFAGIACGLLRLSLPLLLTAVFIISALSAVLGYITGRSLGVEPSGKAYALGGGLLCALGIALQMIQLG